MGTDVKKKFLDQWPRGEITVYYSQQSWKLQDSCVDAVAAIVSMEMCSLKTVIFVAVVAAASFTPVYLQFCHSHDETTSDCFRSRWNARVSHRLQDLDQFKVSSKKLMGKSDLLFFFFFIYCVSLQTMSVNNPNSIFSTCRSISYRWGWRQLCSHG